MPHSPRWHDGRLWFLKSGTGKLMVTIPALAGRKSYAVCRAICAGLCFHGPYAMIGLSKIREKHIFGGLPLQAVPEKLLCGVAVVDVRSGRATCFFEFTSGCEELYDVRFLPGVRRPTLLNLEKSAVRQATTNPDSSFWFRPSSEIHESTPATSAMSAGEGDGDATFDATPLETPRTLEQKNSGSRKFVIRNDCHVATA